MGVFKVVTFAAVAVFYESSTDDVWIVFVITIVTVFGLVVEVEVEVFVIVVLTTQVLLFVRVYLFFGHVVTLTKYIT